MESITKNRQPASALRAIVARAFGSDQVPEGAGWAEELGHGWFNVVYAIRLRDGRRVALKIAPPAGIEVMTYERGMLAREVAALELIGRRTDVPVPTVLSYDTSRELCDAEYFFMEYVDAANLGVVWDELSDGECDRYATELGAATRQINEITGDRFGVPGATEPDSAKPGAGWREVFTGMVSDVLDDGLRRGVELGWDYELIRGLSVQHAECLDEVTVPRLVEWDLWHSNVLVRDGAIVSIIDHERVFYGDPLMEAGFAAAQLGAQALADGFARGYGLDAREFTAAEQSRRRLYDLHLTLIMVIETVYRGHTDPAEYNFARGRLDRVMAGFGHHR
ncbi:aminoglycoside phosphotransferase family protein [Actinospica durhamensis]|uniref:Aminoglycoside phosphotransferase family protein n=1 Tax=Actinospica durhamensis TaxID=1508375 RepID=A0A941IUG3_9ACTN|nr:aminoglycoside phosphotransferase family protein [Actinospica durhamensis]MBR7837433.1 aminoglycoside phosphotransferase family protein [Actinospica durhamensis]